MEEKCYTLRDFLEVFYKVKEHELSKYSKPCELIAIYDALDFLEKIAGSLMCSTEGHDFYMMGNIICELRDRCKKIIKSANVKEEKYLRTYVKHEESDKWFFVSSTHKIFSNGLGNSETMVWEWDNEKNERIGHSIGTYCGSYNNSLNHMMCVENLLQDGELDDEEEREDD